jgi:hypothetical protein
MDVDRFKRENPGVQRIYNRTRGRDTLEVRVRKKFPQLPKSCQAAGCTEARVLELAHRPEFKRNGAWRSIALYQPHMIWVLCPTHHRLIDRGICAPAEFGLQ